MAAAGGGGEVFVLPVGKRDPALRRYEESGAHFRDHRGAHRLQAFLSVLPVFRCGRHDRVHAMSFDMAGTPPIPVGFRRPQVSITNL